MQARPRADVAIRSNVTSRGNVTANARAPPQEEEEVQVALSRALAALAATFGRYFSLRKLCALQDHLLNKVAPPLPPPSSSPFPPPHPLVHPQPLPSLIFETSHSVG